MSRHKLLPLMFILLWVSCNSMKSDMYENSYNYFTLVSYPNDYAEIYPEAVLIFTFSDEIKSSALDKISVTCEKDELCAVDIDIKKNSVYFQNLPEQDTIEIVFETGIKSVDNRPLVITEEDILSSRDVSFIFNTTVALPEVIDIIPDKESFSHTAGLHFSRDILTDQAIINPKPDRLLHQNEFLLLYYESVPDKIRIKNIMTPDRPGEVEIVTLHPKQTETTPENISIENEKIGDLKYNATFASKSIIALFYDSKLTFCDKTCKVEISDLKPQTEYNFSFEVFTIDSYEIVEKNIITAPPAPHIMISEVMHSPLGEPQKNYEFVELYNYGTVDFPLNGCTIDDKDDGKGEDPLIPLSKEKQTLPPGHFALILGNESKLFESLHEDIVVFFVDDSTIADAGITSSETLQINCSAEKKREAEYVPPQQDTEKGFSIIIDTEKNICQSEHEGGSPGKHESCSGR